MNFSWINDAKRGFKRFAVLGAVCLAALAATFTAGFLSGRSVRRAAPAAAVPVDGSAEAMARRNIVWRVWNGDRNVPDSPDRAIAAALGAILHPGATVESRNAGLSMYLQKSVAYFSQEEIAAIQETVGDGSPARMAATLRRISDADHRAATLVREVLADETRLGLFQAGKPIPLESLPDGSAP